MKSTALVVFICASLCLVAQSPSYNPTATRAFGQPQLALESGNPNLVEGREFYGPASIAFDNSVSPPRLYIADFLNNRVLAWKNASAITKGNFADLVIGQNDRFSTVAGGPRRAQTIGMTYPSAVAVDANGNLYVADGGNNRILRFPKPFAQSSMPITPDIVIGQHSFSSGNSANEGAGIPSAQTVALTSGNSVLSTSMVFDKQGNLWVADSGNNRVLRFPAATLAANQSEPAADLVLGQLTFASNAIQQNRTRQTKTTTTQPSGLAFSEAGDLYVSDVDNRVLYFKGPIASNGQPATRILGSPTPSASDPNPPALNGCPTAPPQPCEFALGVLNTNAPPTGLAVLNNSVYVADPGNNRIVKYDTPDKWVPECIYTGTACPSGTLISPPGILFIGQKDGESTKANQGSGPANNTLAQPEALAFLGTDLWVADFGNSRVIDIPQQGGTYAGATNVLGQIDFQYNAPNLIEGRELYMYNPLTNAAGGGIAIDKTSNPPHLYIADTFNNRILGFADARNLTPGQKADIVIGQPDLFGSSPNYFTHDVTAPTDLSLSGPVGLQVVNGDLWVADSGNARVVRFPQPFAQTPPYRVNMVIGQAGAFNRILDPTQSTMRSPYGIAFTHDGSLLVSDAALNRVLVFKKPANGDFSVGQPATSVIGQPNFTSFTSGNTPNRFNSPHGIAVDGNDRMYVADTGNGRVSIFSGTDVNNATPDPPARFSPGVSSPLGVAVNSYGEVWVTDTGNGRMLRFPIYETWFQTNSAISQLVPAATNDLSYPTFPVAIALDANDNPVIGESTNRVTLYFPQATFQNWASFATVGLTPGGLSYLYRYGPGFGVSSAVASGFPLPTTLGDLQVLVNGSPVPIYQVSNTRVDFQTSWGTPYPGTADVQLVRNSTREVLAAGTFAVNVADPGLFTASANGSGQLAVLNQDGSVNSPTNPAARGSVISLFGTGLGPISNPPPDGMPATGLAPAAGLPIVATNPGGSVDASNISYFGLVNWFPGVFQMNLTIPQSVLPSPTVQFGFFWQDYPSTAGPTDRNSGQPTRLVTTIAVK